MPEFAGDGPRSNRGTAVQSLEASRRVGVTEDLQGDLAGFPASPRRHRVHSLTEIANHGFLGIMSLEHGGYDAEKVVHPATPSYPALFCVSDQASTLREHFWWRMAR